MFINYYLVLTKDYTIRLIDQSLPLILILAKLVRNRDDFQIIPIGKAISDLQASGSCFTIDKDLFFGRQLEINLAFLL